MSIFRIKGGHSLFGQIEIKGMKNAITPILTATLLASGEYILENVPRITDVFNMLEILKDLGVEYSWLKENTLLISTKNIEVKKFDQKVSLMRSSILFLGPILARFKKIEIPEPGGCIIGNRPIDTHLLAFKQMGAKVAHHNNLIKLKVDKLSGSKVILPEFSVTATENIMMAGVLARGKTVIKLAASEPHVQDLGNFLKKMGAKISGLGTSTIVINGVRKLKSVKKYKIIPDQIEIGTFAVIGALTNSKIKIKNIIPEHLDIILLKLKEIGVKFELGKNYLKIFPSSKLKAFKLQTMPYPGFPTDLQAPFSVLATQSQGVSLIQETLYEGRFNHINELIKMGANAIIADPHRVIINGPTPLYGREIKSFDLRAGATLIIAGLIAQGETIINQAEIIDRGYEKIDQRLKNLGAEIERI